MPKFYTDKLMANLKLLTRIQLANPVTRYALSFGFTVFFVGLIVPINEQLAFEPITDHRSLVVSRILKLFFSLSLFFVTYFFITFFWKLRSGDARYKSWFKISSIYLAIMAVFFLLLYPGAWVWDEFSILDAAKQYSLYSWQHYFTNIYYTFSMYLIPTAVSIVIVQLVFLSLVVGYVMSALQPLFTKQRLVYALFIVLLLPPVILNNFYPLRMTAYTYLMLLLLVKLYVLHVHKYKVSNVLAEIFQFSIIITLLAFWRTEGFYFVLLLPWLLYAMRRHVSRRIIYTAASLATACVGTGFAITQYTNDPLYSVTAMVNPLSVMLQKPLQGDQAQDKLAVIDKVISVDKLKQTPDFEAIPSFYSPDFIRKDYQVHLKDAQKAYVYLILNNPDDFLSARLKTLASTNSFGERPAFVYINTLADRPHSNVLIEQESQDFIRDNYFARPLSYDVKKQTSHLLMQYNGDDRPTFLNHVIWNALPPIIGLVIFGIWQAFKRRFIWTLLCALIVSGVGLLFLTAPANFFMYYFPAYMNGYFVLLLAFLLYWDKRQADKS